MSIMPYLATNFAVFITEYADQRNFFFFTISQYSQYIQQTSVFSFDLLRYPAYQTRIKRRPQAW